MPSLLLAILRLALAFASAAIFIVRPAASRPRLASYGMLIGAGQLGLRFVALNGHEPPGLALLVLAGLTPNMQWPRLATH